MCLSALLLTVQNNPLTTYGPKLQLMSCCRVIKIIETLYIAAFSSQLICGICVCRYTSFFPLITKATRITNHTETLIDNIFTNNLEKLNNSINAWYCI